MTCDDAVEHLAGAPMATTVGTANPLPATVTAHLEACPHCSALANDLARLAALTRGLSRETPPQRDLWPTIAERLATVERLPADAIAHRRHRLEGLRLVAAAAVLVLAASGVTLLWQRATPPRVATGSSTSTVAAFVPAAQTLAQAYGPLDRELFALYEQHADRLSPATREVIARNLAVIDAAMADIRAALAADPSRAALIRDLDQLHRQRLDLLTGAATLGARL